MGGPKVIVAGAGIGGLATALYLHRAGIEVEVFEQAGGIRELGVGINVLPHSTAELADLGLLEALDAVAIRTGTLVYQNRFGQTVWSEPRGVAAGYDVPQFSIHRGRLQGVLYRAAVERLGAEKIHTGHRLVAFEEDGTGITARFATPEGMAVTARGDILVGADGIHSAVRRIFFPEEGPPAWNGMMMWRGAAITEPFGDGRTMVIAGGMDAKAVIYPIADEADGKQLMNWALCVREGDGSVPPPRREDWNRVGRWEDIAAGVDLFTLDVLDFKDLILKSGDFYEYPMCDRDPLPRWSHGRATLLGDAAHPMYPVGSNGSAQAILDAKALAGLLSEGGDPVALLARYDEERRPKTAEIVRLNRKGGPERVIDVVTERAPNGFDNLDDVASPEELEAIVKGYAGKAGFTTEVVNRPAAAG
ncbi:flavin-dependent oxidoreductase [Acuticoccus mangrovi]|uniref:Flavin-dependent oxidoreductase n=1 Tax=Acuticoccus mangrovi TaxID=2796142 RepID=A0A934MGE1_9HYPH|nr:flavin-dependent oxidoreductase [Acuticoccus mangrovi]MBJ3775840.1 flavin-dependent oxidoreductase [Acuticoccus mangrovi]